jgi:hypothetical protein
LTDFFVRNCPVCDSKAYYDDLALDEYFSQVLSSKGKRINLETTSWVKWLRMQGHLLPATLEVTGSNPGPGKINLIKN